jgi:hypothetical protein
MPKRRILIWGKTYPELSTKYFETVCCGGVFEDTGQPVRLYPIPYRYLEGTAQFSKYQWITADVAKSSKDPRPESYKIDTDSMELQETLPTTSDEWGKRGLYLFKNPEWQFESVEALQVRERENGTSIGIVSPRSIEKVEVATRPKSDYLTFEEKVYKLVDALDAKARQFNLFAVDSTPVELKDLTYLRDRIRVDWKCFGPECKGHKMQILDWEVAELHRKHGDTKALQRVREICDLDHYATKFFLGNFFLHPTAFTIVGLWYPKRAKGRLFI